MQAFARREGIGIPVLSGAILLSAALYNGYPLTFWDTRAYVEHAGTLLPRSDRLIGYSLFIRALSWHFSLWPVVVAQCLLIAWLLYRVARTVTGKLPGGGFVAMIAALAVGTALPWTAGQLMPDVFTPMLVIALFLLVEDVTLRLWERWALFGLVAACVAIHASHFPIGACLCAVAFVAFRWFGEARSLARFRLPAVALVTGLVGIAGFNFARTGTVSLASGSDAFVLGHLVESGIASRELDAHCPERGYFLCRDRALLPMSCDDFLWVDRLNIDPWGRSGPIALEARRLLRDSLREYPALHLRVFVDYTLRTFFAVHTGEGLDNEAQGLVEPQIARYAPRDVPAYRAARQQASTLPVEGLRRVHTPISLLMLAVGLGALAIGARRRDGLRDPCLRFLFFVYVALLLNALIAGNISGVHDRFGARLSWLSGFGVWAAWARGHHVWGRLLRIGPRRPTASSSASASRTARQLP